MKNEIFKDIKPCPFCGSKVEVNCASYSDGVYGTISFFCPVCGFINITTIADNNKSRLDAYFDVWQNRPDRSEDDLK